MYLLPEVLNRVTLEIIKNGQSVRHMGSYTGYFFSPPESNEYVKVVIYTYTIYNICR